MLVPLRVNVASSLNIYPPLALGCGAVIPVKVGRPGVPGSVLSVVRVLVTLYTLLVRAGVPRSILYQLPVLGLKRMA